MEETKKYSEFAEKIMHGVKLAFKKLIKESKPDDVFIFYEEGKIVRKKAKDIVLEKE